MFWMSANPRFSTGASASNNREKNKHQMQCDMCISLYQYHVSFAINFVVRLFAYKVDSISVFFLFCHWQLITCDTVLYHTQAMKIDQNTLIRETCLQVFHAYWPIPIKLKKKPMTMTLCQQISIRKMLLLRCDEEMPFEERNSQKFNKKKTENTFQMVNIFSRLCRYFWCALSIHPTASDHLVISWDRLIPSTNQNAQPQQQRKTKTKKRERIYILTAMRQQQQK